MTNARTGGPNRRRAKACEGCNTRKIRCQLSEGMDGCDACNMQEIDCVPHMRKKRRGTAATYTAKTSPDGFAVPRPSSWASVGGVEVVPEQSDNRNQHSSQSRAFPGSQNPTMEDLQNFDPVEAQYDSSFDISGDLHVSNIESATPKSIVQKEVTTLIGRSHYIAPDMQIDEELARAYPHSKNENLSSTSVKTLELWGSSNLPSRATSQSLFDAYMERCYPWAPVIRPQDLANFDQPLFSLLLKQAVFVAGSRVTSGPGVVAYASTGEFYHRAKALFWQSHEQDPLIVIAATILLQWYNPDGPEHVTFDGSGFWHQIAVGISRQVGLHKESTGTSHSIIRRRLWWTLVVRDCLLSASQGRPRAMSLEDCDVKPPCLEDFPDSSTLGMTFIHYVDICLQMAALAECCLRKHLPHEKRIYLENSLFKWSRTLPESLRIGRSKTSANSKQVPYNFNAHQLHLPYFTTVAMLARAKDNHHVVSPAKILASSFVAGIFEDILARDEQKFLPSVFTFYILAAGVALVSLRKYPALWAIAQQDLEILQTALDQLGQRWASARGAKRALLNIIRQSTSSFNESVAESLIWLSMDENLLFEGFPPTLCRLWIPYETFAKTHPTTDHPPPIQTTILRATGAPEKNMTTTFYDPIAEGLESIQYDGIGNWLFGDWATETSW